MDKLLEIKLIDLITDQVSKHGVCSIKQAADSMSYPDLKLSEQKTIAKHLVKKFPFTTEIKKREIMVYPNKLFTNSNEAKQDSTWIIVLLVLLGSGLAFILLRLLLPGFK